METKRQIKIEVDVEQHMQNLKVLEDGIGPTGTPWESKILKAAQSFVISFFGGENELVISLMPMHRGFTDIAVVYARIMNPHKFRRMAVRNNIDVNVALNTLVNEIVEGSWTKA